MSRPAQMNDDRHTEDAERREICCSMSACALRVVRAHGGQAAVDELLAEAGSARSDSYLNDPQNWISLEEATALLEAGGRVIGDQLFPRRVGEEALRQFAGSSVATLLR